MSTTTPMVTATPSTTYPYTYTTFTNPSPSTFTRPTAIPSIFSWGSVESCSASASATSSSTPNAPLERPSNRAGGCTISNEAGVNDHAFWDLYACCESGNMSALGAPLPCTAVCWADGDQSFLDLGRCLSERVEVVICSPPEEERGQQPEGTSDGAGASATSTVKTQSQSQTQSGTSSADATGPAFTGAASTVGPVHVASSKAGLVVFGLVALASSAAMFL